MERNKKKKVRRAIHIDGLGIELELSKVSLIKKGTGINKMIHISSFESWDDFK